MRILIAYTSKNGVTAECAQVLANKLGDTNEIVLQDMKKQGVEPAEKFDIVVLGSSIRMGKASKEIKNYNAFIQILPLMPPKKVLRQA